MTAILYIESVVLMETKEIMKPKFNKHLLRGDESRKAADLDDFPDEIPEVEDDSEREEKT
ncbi:MAG: hypothetical protein GF411_03560 [Candidatus Lokiarchaeota archaeon]|nr:hypothetical protein [Candidatus Lokiarchaeota archaeon]